MRGKLMFLGGLAAGFVLGSRAGRQAYEDLMSTARKVKDSPTVQEAAGVVQAQATRLYEQGKESVSHTRLGDRLLHPDKEPVAVGAGNPVNSTGAKAKGASSGTDSTMS